MGTPPKWAQKLLLDSLVWWEEQGHEVPLVSLDWGKRKGKSSSGNASHYSMRIRISQGTSKLDTKIVLLHETAHLLVPIREHHSPLFWDVAWDLFRWAKLPIEYCLRREGNYRKGAVVAYHRGRTK